MSDLSAEARGAQRRRGAEAERVVALNTNSQLVSIELNAEPAPQGLDERMVLTLTVKAEQAGSQGTVVKSTPVDLAVIMSDVPVPAMFSQSPDSTALAPGEFWAGIFSDPVQSRLLSSVTRILNDDIRSLALSLGDRVANSEDDPVSEADAEVKALFRRANMLSTGEIVDELGEVLTQSLIAYMTRTTDRTVRDWINGSSQQPRLEAEKRLLAAVTALFILKEEEAPQSIRRWFINANPNLDDLSPAEAIREGCLRSVIRAARAYAVYAY
ncbi:MAG: hypothetical protein M3014_01500 [Chloroflexota bacterium]|nr:hypothetical protein [Chloroflexota bacterium]